MQIRYYKEYSRYLNIRSLVVFGGVSINPAHFDFSLPERPLF